MWSLQKRFVRYAFRSPEKVALQEIGPRFTLKLRWLKSGLPEVRNFGASPEALKITTGTTEESIPPPEEVADRDDNAGEDDEMSERDTAEPVPLAKISPPKDNEYLWRWKVCRIAPRESYADMLLARTGSNKTDFLPLILVFCIYIPLAVTRAWVVVQIE